MSKPTYTVIVKTEDPHCCEYPTRTRRFWTDEHPSWRPGDVIECNVCGIQRKYVIDWIQGTWSTRWFNRKWVK